jgi:hypothetical protein
MRGVTEVASTLQAFQANRRVLELLSQSVLSIYKVYGRLQSSIGSSRVNIG